jgi:4-alpha-glucanotransferase
MTKPTGFLFARPRQAQSGREWGVAATLIRRAWEAEIMTDLAQAAARLGLITSFVDGHGRLHAVDTETLHELVDLLGAQITNEADRGIAVIRNGHASTPLPATGLWQNIVTDAAPVETPCAPTDLPVGTYRLVPDPPGSSAWTVLCAPPRCFQPEVFATGQRLWLLAVQLYGVRSRRNWGHGDFTDLANLLRVVARLGGAGIALNPLHALFDDRPEQASPYAPNSRLFLNPLYIDLEAVPEFAGQGDLSIDAELARLRNAERVDYRGVGVLKVKGLRLAYARFLREGTPARRADFDRFRAQRAAELRGFAAFEVLRREFSGPWWDWPAPWNRPDDQALAELAKSRAEELGFYEYCQWLADRQLAACAQLARDLHLPIGLYLDLALGVEGGGADAWAQQEAMLRGVSVGAPPDQINTEGQDWGLAPFNPQQLANEEFASFRALLAAVMRHAGAVRLDHVLGLNRLYIIPHGAGARRGAYIAFPLEAMLAVIAQESVRHRCLVIGEDLGTVPETFRETMADWGLWRSLVLLFERDHAFHGPGSYAADAAASFSTHDLATFRGWLSGHDRRVKLALGMDPGETEEARKHAYEALARAFAAQGLEGGLTYDNVVRFLARTASRLIVLSAEDLFGVEDQPNLPGTVAQHPNWQQRLPVALEDFEREPAVAALGEILRHEGRASPSATGL